MLPISAQSRPLSIGLSKPVQSSGQLARFWVQRLEIQKCLPNQGEPTESGRPVKEMICVDLRGRLLVHGDAREWI